MARQGRAGTRAGAGNMVLPVQGIAQGHSGHQAPFSQLLSRECHPQAVLEPGAPSMGFLPTGKGTFFTQPVCSASQFQFPLGGRVE